ncbi:4-alpha-glucanotransferase [Chitinispirillales bacterium ANBcel5]|uniref:4-alpha-glucanotransferase n=1 Tax=Cellulosispirillum alkaliphilum TaxID=3039283 RepID=UPI002A582E1F|nr:4-alpha-glucanotransferase [Chitinispirillales bacterium ANBcel5]
MYTRGSGVLMHITSLPSIHGIGDLGPQAYRFADYLSDVKQKYWQMLPLNAGNPTNGESPYFSSSAFAGNPLLISLELLASEGLLDDKEISPIKCDDESKISFEEVRSFKFPLLDKAYLNWQESKKQKAEFYSFCNDNSHWLDNYALFIIIGEKMGTYTWHKWPRPLRDRESKALKEIADEHCQQIEKVKFFQFLFFSQLKALKKYCHNLKISIIGDLPIYVSYESTDVWENKELFKLNEDGIPVAISGVPPDYFSETGQLWGNPVYNWDNLSASRYDWWIRRMEMLFLQFDIVRIDHFRGLVQYWEVPAGEETAINGKWVDVPTSDFLDTMKSHFKTFPVIAEDLGIITPDVVEVMNRYGFPGMKILQFAFSEDTSDNPYLPHNYPRNSLVYTGTHDNNTTVGWIKNDLDKKGMKRVCQYIGFTPQEDDLPEHIIRLAQSSVADIAVVPVQDLLKLDEKARMNHPAYKFGNWRWRATREQIDSLPKDKFARMVSTYGR